MAFHSYKLFKSHKSIKKLVKERSGQIFSIDLLFALIIITIIMGMSANALDMAGNKISDYSAGMSLDRIATDAADILINTPGPLNWEKSNITPLIKPGLAVDSNNSVNSTKILSYNKIAKLKASYDELLSNILPPSVKSALTVETTSSSLGTIVVSNKTPPADVSEVTTVNRTVLVNFRDYVVLVRVDKSSPQDQCPHSNYSGSTVHNEANNQNTTNWHCKTFKVTRKELNTTEFYLLTDPDNLDVHVARWIMDRPDNLTDSPEMFNANPIQLNQKIKDIMGDDEEAVIWLHVSSSDLKQFTTYIVAVPLGTPSDEIKTEYLNPQPCFFILRLWME